MKLLIVGFNARPIAKSAQEAGHEIGVIDYFGDLDLLKLTKNCFSVLRQKQDETLHRELHRKPAEYLYILAEIMCDEQNDFDGILLGSSFDRYPEIVESFSKLGPKLYANNSRNYELTRDKKKINELAKNAGFEIPKLASVNDYREAIEIGEELGYPLVTRENGGGGGAGIKLWHSSQELESYYREKDKEPLWVQEYIDGIDASASIICSESNSRIISINRQLMGDKKLGAPNSFSYCGNVTPLDINKQMNSNVFYDTYSAIIIDLFSNLSLIGSNGIDFVVANNKLFFMEINPRIQGSLECIQNSINKNIINLHLNSFKNDLDEVNIKPKYKRWGFKGILFSNKEDNFVVKKYPKTKTIVDRTHYNVILEYGDPVCSIVFSSNNLQKGYNKLYKIANEIISVNK